MSSNNKPNLDEPNTVKLTVSKPADFKNRKRTGITLGQYKELSAKDRAELTPQEQRQLEQAQQQLSKLAETIASQYDFTAITKSIQGIYKLSPAFQAIQSMDTSPILKVATNMQKYSVGVQSAMVKAYGIQTSLAPALQAIHKSTLFTQNQFTALAAIQKSLVNFPTENVIASIKSIQEAFQTPLIARTMFAEFHNKHERVLRGLKFDVGSLSTDIEFSHFETVETTIHDVTSDKNDLAATASATQTNSVGNVTFTDNASLMLAFNDLKDEVRDLKQLLIAKDNQQGKLLVAPSSVHFQRLGSTVQVQLGALKVTVSISSNYTRLARFLLSSPDNIVKKWDIEDLAREVYDTHFANAQDEEEWKNRIKGYASHFNQQVMIASGGKMPKFIDSSNKGVVYFINQDYLNL